MILFYDIYGSKITILVRATTINMIKIPRLPVEEGSVVEYVCKTDSFYPNPTAVLWFVDDESVDEHDVHTEQKFSLSLDQNGQMTQSVLRLIAKREMNGRTVKCVLKNDITKSDKSNLNVMCKYLLVHMYIKVTVLRFPLLH